MKTYQEAIEAARDATENLLDAIDDQLNWRERMHEALAWLEARLQARSIDPHGQAWRKLRVLWRELVWTFADWRRDVWASDFEEPIADNGMTVGDALGEPTAAKDGATIDWNEPTDDLRPSSVERFRRAALDASVAATRVDVPGMNVGNPGGPLRDDDPRKE